MLRGINKQDIFFDDEDRARFLYTLQKYKSVCGYEIYGYCLMRNHIHLLIKEGKESISQAMKRIGTSFVYWYNLKYERCGHLFQDRYKSEPVEDDRYLLVVLRYIHQNPVKALQVSNPALYKWSSYRDYIDNKNNKLTDIDFILDILNPRRRKAVEEYKTYMKEDSNEQCLEDVNSNGKHLSDEDAINLFNELTQLKDPKILQEMSKMERDAIIKILKENRIPIRQLARITGLGRGIIQKAK